MSFKIHHFTVLMLSSLLVTLFSQVCLSVSVQRGDLPLKVGIGSPSLSTAGRVQEKDFEFLSETGEDFRTARFNGLMSPDEIYARMPSSIRISNSRDWPPRWASNLLCRSGISNETMAEIRLLHRNDLSNRARNLRNRYKRCKSEGEKLTQEELESIRSIQPSYPSPKESLENARIRETRRAAFHRMLDDAGPDWKEARFSPVTFLKAVYKLKDPYMSNREFTRKLFCYMGGIPDVSKETVEILRKIRYQVGRNRGIHNDVRTNQDEAQERQTFANDVLMSDNLSQSKMISDGERKETSVEEIEHSFHAPPSLEHSQRAEEYSHYSWMGAKVPQRSRTKLTRVVEGPLIASPLLRHPPRTSLPRKSEVGETSRAMKNHEVDIDSEESSRQPSSSDDDGQSDYEQELALLIGTSKRSRAKKSTMIGSDSGQRKSMGGKRDTAGKTRTIRQPQSTQRYHIIDSLLYGGEDFTRSNEGPIVTESRKTTGQKKYRNAQPATEKDREATRLTIAKRLGRGQVATITVKID